MPSPHILVVGGTKGIGRAVARTLTRDGARVSVLGRSRPPGDVPYRVWTVDVSDTVALSLTLAEVLAVNGPVSGIVLLQRYRGGDDAWTGEIATTLTATRAVIEWAADALQDLGAGRSIVVVSSIASHYVASEQPVSYHVGKAALSHMVRYYAVALGSRGLRVNAICPGTTVKEESKAYYAAHPEIEALYREIVPLRRMGTSDDVAELAAFLLSDRSSFLTGQNIVLDGGVSLHSHESLSRSLVQKKA